MNVYQRLNNARTAFHLLKLEKTGHNKFAGYKYFELGDFLIPALKVFREHGLCAVVSFDADTATMVIRDAENPTECITITSPMGSANLKGCHEVQNIGAVETYQRRYLWVAALEIVEHDALDSTTGKDSAKRAGPVGDYLETVKLSQDVMSAMDALAETLQGDFDGYGIEAACERLDVETLEHDAKVYLWSRLGSKIRSAIKKHNEATKEKA